MNMTCERCGETCHNKRTSKANIPRDQQTQPKKSKGKRKASTSTEKPPQKKKSEENCTRS